MIDDPDDHEGQLLAKLADERVAFMTKVTEGSSAQASYNNFIRPIAEKWKADLNEKLIGEWISGRRGHELEPLIAEMAAFSKLEVTMLQKIKIGNSSEQKVSDIDDESKRIRAEQEIY